VSNLVAGSIVVAAGCNAAFAFLGALAAAGFVLYLIAMPETSGDNFRRRNRGRRRGQR
jgi:hypothetical protein